MDDLRRTNANMAEGFNMMATMLAQEREERALDREAFEQRRGSK